MTLILSGTDGLSDIDGSAATPAIRGTDTNTGIFFPAADTIAFSEGGVEAMRIDSSGNVGIGTSSPATKLHVSGQSRVADSSNTANYMTFGVGANAPYGNASISTTTAGLSIVAEGAGNMTFLNNGSERARITSGGNLLVGTTTDNGRITVYRNSSVAGDGIVTCYSDSGSTNNIRLVLRVDGGLANYQANNTNLSDGRIKKNIEISGNYLAKICAIPVKLFNYKDEPDGAQRSLGVIAQDVEAVAPELISNEGFGETPEDGVPLKTVYQTDLQYALMKCIQEQQAIIQSLTARIEALEGK